MNSFKLEREYQYLEQKLETWQQFLNDQKEHLTKQEEENLKRYIQAYYDALEFLDLELSVSNLAGVGFVDEDIPFYIKIYGESHHPLHKDLTLKAILELIGMLDMGGLLPEEKKQFSKQIIQKINRL